MPADPETTGVASPPTLLIPEIRDYQKINAEVKALLDRGHSLIRLEGAEGQRLLASGLSGHWRATIEVVGRTGPELAAGLDAPGLTVVARGSTADGVALGLRSGLVILDGDAGDGSGYAQTGGVLIITGTAGHRAGLMQSGGIMAVFGPVGRLSGVRQSGGRLFLAGLVGPHAGWGARGGRRIVRLEPKSLDPEDAEAWSIVMAKADGWVELPKWSGR